jgi:peptidoglycan hydrolase-like protein with peptidoglycan-binding domain
MSTLRLSVGTALTYLLIIFSFVVIVPIADAAALTRDLTVGAVGEDVRDLQKFLNTDAATVVAPSGVGSPGNESTYFGPATSAAVARFQAKYPDETYKKAGLSAPNGFVGALTRQVINSKMGFVTRASAPVSGFVYDPDVSALPALTAPTYDAPLYTAQDAFKEAYSRDFAATVAASKAAAYAHVARLGASTTVGVRPAGATATTTSQTRPSTDVASMSSTSSDPVVMFVAPGAAEIGDRVSVFGTALPKDLRIRISNRVARIKGVSKDGIKGYFTVPRGIEVGVYTLEFSSKKEIRDLVAPFDETLSIVDDIVVPIIKKYPDTFESGQVITIEGDDFSADGETYLVGAFGRLKAIESSQSEATFELPYVRDIVGRDVVIPNGVQPRSMMFVIETNAGVSEGFTTVVRLK